MLNSSFALVFFMNKNPNLQDKKAGKLYCFTKKSPISYFFVK
ncbi:hypothetical protein HMPREF3218_0200470 [Prevotella bivia]|nr:hypothetical protein HMPREF3218_0200470 [Prevotella bivia]